MTREFEYVPLAEALRILKRAVRPSPGRDLAALADSFGRVLFEDVVSKADLPPADSSHMDGFAVRSSDTTTASKEEPVSLRLVRSSPLGVIPKQALLGGEARPVLTGGFLPRGADAVVQVERVRVDPDRVVLTRPLTGGEFVFAKGRDIKKGERVMKKGRTIRGTDVVLLASLHLDRIPVYRRPRVAIIPTGDELSAEVRNTEPGKVVETHSLLLARLIEGAGGVPVALPIVRDDLEEIAGAIGRALADADLVLTLAGSSVGEPDLTEKAIAKAGRPGVLVHGMQVFRGRVMGFGAVGGKGIVILPGPVQGAVNAFALMAYPLIRSFLGRGFEEPPSLPATVSLDWEASGRYRDFTKMVYARLLTSGAELLAEPSAGETEKVTHLTRNDGYIVVDGDKVSLARGERVRVHLMPGLSPSSFLPDQ